MTFNKIENRCKEVLSKLDDMIPHQVHVQPSKYAILTGGAIASMLQGENPVDYDIFFDNSTTLKKIMNYYAKLVVENTEHSYLEVESYTDILGETAYRFNVEPKGIQFEKNNELGLRYITRNAISFENGIQIITRFYGNVDKIHSTFDFTHAMNYCGNRLVLDPKLMLQATSKKLIYKGSRYPVSSILRAFKFIKRGYSISRNQLMKIMLDISQLDLTDSAVLQDQLEGVYVAGGHIATKFLEQSATERSFPKDFSWKVSDIVGIKDIFNKVDEDF